MGVPRSAFVVLGADRLWTNALPKPEDPPSEKRGRQSKIALHGSLPLAVAAAGLATLGSERDTVDYIRELITPLDKSSLNFDTIVERLRAHLHEKVQAMRDQAKRALATNPADAEARMRLKVARLTLVVAYVEAGRATLGWAQLDDEWKAKRESAPHGAVAWPDSLDRFYTKGPFAGGASLFGYSIQEPAKLVEHVRRSDPGGHSRGSPAQPRAEPAGWRSSRRCPDRCQGGSLRPFVPAPLTLSPGSGLRSGLPAGRLSLLNVSLLRTPLRGGGLALFRDVRPGLGSKAVARNVHGLRPEGLQDVSHGVGVGDERAVLDMRVLLADQPCLIVPGTGAAFARDPLDPALLPDVVRAKRRELSLRSYFDVIVLALSGGSGRCSLPAFRLRARPSPR
jgi:hypothetical protein